MTEEAYSFSIAYGNNGAVRKLGYLELTNVHYAYRAELQLRIATNLITSWCLELVRLGDKPVSTELEYSNLAG